MHPSGVFTALFSCYMAVPRDTAAVSVQVMCTPYNHAPSQVILCKATFAGSMRVKLKPATCTFARMTGIFYVL